MKFTNLIIENFLAITEGTVNFADRGLVLIQGKNSADTSANSNGAGKSSIADALCWCWFGVTARDVSGDDVINDAAGKNCKVSSQLLDGSMLYTATRHRKHKTGKNSLTLTVHDGIKETDLTKGTDKLTQAVADQIIGSSLEVFVGSIYAGQEKMPDLPAMTDKTLKVLIEEAAGVTVLEKAYQLARTDLQSVTLRREIIDRELRGRQDKLENLKSTLVETQAQALNWNLVHASEIASQTLALGTMVKTIRSFDEELAAIKIADIKTDITEIDRKIAAVSGEHAKVSTLTIEAERKKTAHEAAINRAHDAERIQKILATKLTEVDHKVGCPCDECGRPLTAAELGVARKAVELRIAQNNEDVRLALKDVELQEEAAKRALQELSDFQVGVTDISAEQARRAVLASQERRYNELGAQRVHQMENAKALKAAIEKARTETNPFEPSMVKITESIVTAEAGIVTVAQQLADVETEIEHEAELVKVFSPAGVRARILDEVTPFLNAQTAKYLSTMSDGNIDANWTTLTPGAKKGEFKEKFSIEVESVTGGNSFRKLSGGEKRKVRISTALALQDLVATRASKPIDLFIGDEIDHALDPAGLERLMIILNDKAAERGSVFVISHNSLTDHISQVLTIEKTATGQTVISEATT